MILVSAWHCLGWGKGVILAKSGQRQRLSVMRPEKVGVLHREFCLWVGFAKLNGEILQEGLSRDGNQNKHQ